MGVKMKQKYHLHNNTGYEASRVEHLIATIIVALSLALGLYTVVSWMAEAVI